jgi:Immunity protein family (Imm11)
MDSDYVIWSSEDVTDACHIEEPEGLDRVWELTEGVPRATTFPEDVAFRMNPDYPYNTLLIDNLKNTSLLIVGSRRLKEFLEERVLQKVEYLPVTIIDHKGRTASTEYFIIHPIDPIDCLDLDQSGVRWSVLDDQSIDKVERLVIDRSKIKQDRLLFRFKYYENVVLIQREIAQSIKAAGFTGVRWVELGDFRG